MGDKCGSIYLIIGPVSSGKTKELKKLLNKGLLNGKKCLMISYKYEANLPYPGRHIYISYTKNESSYVTMEISRRVLKDNMDYKELLKYDYIFIDDIHLFTDAVEFCDNLVYDGCELIVSGLQCNHNREPFEVISGLVAKSEKITQLTAIDSLAGKEASFSLLKMDETKEKNNQIDNTI